MQVVQHKDELMGQSVVATIGFFDGVHQGHRFLIEEVKLQAAKRGLPAAVITFPRHPRIILQADYQPKLLNSFDEKLKHLAETGIDYCIIIDFTLEISQFTAKTFLQGALANEWSVKALLIGYDHRFGRDRTDGFEQYVDYGKACGMEVIQATSYTEGCTTVSSSEIRRQLTNGNVQKAAQLLTYPYHIKGSIINGKKIGRRLGFPTANIRMEEPFKILPAIGVYAVNVAWEKRCYNGMLYIGPRPTLEEDGSISLEVNIFDFNEDIYNNDLTVSFIHYIRGDIKFDSIDALQKQLVKDRDTVQKLFKD